jgi:hypothetical protein
VNVKWRVARLRTMSVREVGYRVARSLKTQAESIGFGRVQAPAPRGPAGRAWVDPLPRAFDARPYVQAADEIPAGHLDIRHAELLRFAQAWHVSGERRYLDACRTLLDSWFARASYPAGANGRASLQHAFRLANWAFAWHLLGSDTSPLFRGEQGAAFRLRWLNNVYQHCHFVAGHLSRHSSADHHLIGEALGLFIGALTWPMWSAAGEWQARARRELEREAGAQNFADGVHKEQAIGYHRAAAEMLILAGLLARANAADFSALYWQRVEAMLEFVASIMDTGGNVPAFGDADDAPLLRLDPARSPDRFRSLLATGAVLFRRPEFKRKARSFDAGTHWLLGDAASPLFVQLQGTGTLPIRRAFPHGGYYVLGRDFETSREVRIVADAGPLGYLSVAAHAHADALSFILSAGGSEILIDPGTHTHSAGRWRDYFRGTSAHNTVRIDGVDQSVSGGAFLWLRHAQARVEQFEATETQERLVAQHDGYQRLADPVRHRRLWSFDRSTSILTVADELICKARHDAEWFWHFAPGCEIGVDGNTLTAQSGAAVLKMRFPDALRWRLVVASPHTGLGWYSPAMGEKLPAVTAVMNTTVAGTERFQFELEVAQAGPGPQLAGRRP